VDQMDPRITRPPKFVEVDGWAGGICIDGATVFVVGF